VSLFLSPSPPHRHHDRLYRRLRRRILRPLALCSEDVLRGTSSLEAVWVSFSPRRSPSIDPLSSTIPGRRTLISGLSVLGRITREIKYVTPGKSRSWRWKHEGPVPHSSAVWSLTVISSIEFRMYGWDAISNVRSLCFLPRSRTHDQSACSDCTLADP